MILFSTGSLHTYGLGRVFKLAAEVGYDGVEVIIDDRADSWQADYLRGLSSETGMPIAVLHSPFRLHMAGWPMREGERHLRSLRLAESLEADVLVIHLPARWPYSVLVNKKRQRPIPHLWRRNLRDVRWFERELPFIQAETSVAMAVEIMPMRRLAWWPINAHYWNTLAEWSRFEHLTLDTTHCATWRADPTNVFERVGDKVSHIHLSNYHKGEHKLPHKGKLDLAGFLQRVAASDYKGHITVETSPAAMEAELSAAKVREHMAAALAFCREHYRPEG